MMTLIHRLRRHLFEREISAEPAGRRPVPDRFFTSRLQADGAAPAPSPEGLGGYLGPEPQVKIPFRLGAGDGDVKVVVFSDPPGLLSLAVEKPDLRLGDLQLALAALDALPTRAEQAIAVLRDLTV